MKFTKSLSINEQFNLLIPGGSHTYAKGNDQFPDEMPLYIKSGNGCHVYDLDDNKFIEFGSGLRAVTLGHGIKSIVDAAYEQMKLGSNFVRPALIELDFAEEFLNTVGCGDMVKFGKNGSDVVDAAIKLSRAFTGRKIVAVCGSHPFFSVGDWFIGSTPMNRGIPEEITNLVYKFEYNNIGSLENLFDKFPDQIACVILEAEKVDPPIDNFLKKVEVLTKKNGAIFVLDEMITGFRWHIQGAQKKFGLDPDLSTFGKGIANGFSLAALAGKKEIMNLGGINHNQERVFLLSLTHGGETHSLAAGMATLKFYKENPVIETLHSQGFRLKAGINRVVSELKLENHFKVLGPDCCLVYQTNDENLKSSQAFRTLFLQETIKRGLLVTSLVTSYSHTDEIIDQTIEIIGDALYVYNKALKEGIDKFLVGKSVKPVFRKFA